jgi:AraC-like DNA-binding protein/ligand-binding sensor protein
MDRLTKEELMIEIDEIRKMMSLLSRLLSIRTSFVFTNEELQYADEIPGNSKKLNDFCVIIQQEFKHRCIECDRDKFKEAMKRKEPLIYRCYNGLYEMFLPLFIENFLAGYLHFGQIRSEDDFKIIASECGLYGHSKAEELEKIYSGMIIVRKDKLVLIAELFKSFAELITKNQLIKLRNKRPEFYLKKYVEENLAQPINVKTAAEYVSRSASYVTHKFKEIYGLTFHDYLNRARIEHSKKLLETMPIADVYPLCGFNNRYHFSKVFKSRENITPSEYQKLIKKEVA